MPYGETITSLVARVLKAHGCWGDRTYDPSGVASLAYACVEDERRDNTVVLDSYADENQRFQDEIERLRLRLEDVTETLENFLDGGHVDLWNGSEMVQQMRRSCENARAALSTPS